MTPVESNNDHQHKRGERVHLVFNASQAVKAGHRPTASNTANTVNTANTTNTTNRAVQRSNRTNNLQANDHESSFHSHRRELDFHCSLPNRSVSSSDDHEAQKKSKSCVTMACRRLRIYLYSLSVLTFLKLSFVLTLFRGLYAATGTDPLPQGVSIVYGDFMVDLHRKIQPQIVSPSRTLRTAQTRSEMVSKWLLKHRVVQLLERPHTLAYPSEYSWQMLDNVESISGIRSHARRKEILNDQDSNILYHQPVEAHEPAERLDSESCTPLADWQLGHKPTCSMIHEVNMMPIVQDTDNINSPSHFCLIGEGAYRSVFSILEYDGTARVLKTFRALDQERKNTFDHQSFDRHRRDAVAFEQLTSSPYIVNMYGYCSHSALFNFAPEGDMKYYFLRQERTITERFEIAYNISMALVDAHHIDSLGRATIAHTDIKPGQFILEDGYFKLTDFNRARFLAWNSKENKTCGFRVKMNKGIWRSPEEYRYDVETEKVDVFSLGNILFFLLTKRFPWMDVMDFQEVARRIEKGEVPKFSKSIISHLQSTGHSAFAKYMVRAMALCFEMDPTKRATAKQVADMLQKGIQLENRHHM